MSQEDFPVSPGPQQATHVGEHSNLNIPHSLLKDGHIGSDKKQIPDTGWKGPVPSQDGGESEKDFLNKPPYTWKSVGDKFVPKYEAACWCGNLAFEFHGDPVDAKHCHCRQCQHLHGAPFQWAAIFPKTSVRMIKNGGNSLHFFSTAKKSSDHFVPCKVSCDQCRSPLFDEGRRTVLAFPGSFKFKNGKIPLSFQPTAHIFYSQKVVEILDGVPKWSGHKGESELMQEMTAEEGTMPKYKGEEAMPQADMGNDQTAKKAGP